MSEESTLRLSLEYRDIERGLNNVITKLGRLNEATNGSNKATTQLEKRLADAGKAANLLDGSTKNASRSITGMQSNTSNAARAIAAYNSRIEDAAKATARLGEIQKNNNGRYQDRANGGKFVSKADVDGLLAVEAAGKRAAAGLAALEAQRQKTLADSATAYNKAQAANRTGPIANAATPAMFVPGSQNAVRQARILQLQNKATAESFEELDSAAGNVEGLASLRYALYDASTTLAVFGGALLAGAIAPVATAIQYQRNFADVLRTVSLEGGATGKQATALKQSFMELASEIPVTFQELTKIGSLGGQLAVPKEALDEFAKTVAIFSATTNVSVEETAESFGRLAALLDLNVSNGELEKLSSSIFQVGVTSVATESDIINISTQISSIGKFAGLSADEVIGFSSALASVGIRPELARGVLTRAFTLISEAVSDGGEKLEVFGKVSGQSGKDFAQAWKDSPSTAFVSLLDGINASGDGSVATLKELGIAASRDIPSILKLAQNTDLVNESLRQAKLGFDDGNKAVDAFGNISGTVAAKLQILQNNFANFLATIGGGSLGPIGGSLDLLNGALDQLSTTLNDPIASTILTIVIAGTALVGVAALIAAGLLAGIASMAAFQLIVQQLSTTTGIATVNLATFRATLATLGPAGAKAATGVGLLSKAMKGASIAALAFAGAEVAQAVQSWYKEITGVTPGVEKFGEILDKNAQGRVDDLEKSFGNNRNLGGWSAQFANSAQILRSFNSDSADTANTVADIENSFFGKNLQIGSFGLLNTGLGDFKTNLQDLDTTLSGLVSSGNTAKAYETIREVAKIMGVKPGELIDALKDTKGALDGVGISAPAAKAAVETAASAADEAAPDWSTLADAVHKYVDELYGTEDAAAAYQASLIKLREGATELTTPGEDGSAPDISGLISAQGEVNKTTQAGIDLYGDLRDVIDNAAASAAQLSDGTAAGTQAANAVLADSAEQVRQIGTQLGLSGELLDAFVARYSTDPIELTVIAKTEGLEETATALDGVANPRQADYNATPKNVSPTQATLDEVKKDRLANYDTKLRSDEAGPALDNTRAPNGNDRIALFNTRVGNDEASAELDRIAAYDRVATIRVVANSSQFQLPVTTGATGGLMSKYGILPAYASGGIHSGSGRVRGSGTGTSDQVNAKLSNGEFVQRAKAVQYYGQDFMTAINNLQVPRFAAGGGYGSKSSGGGLGITELGPKSLRELRSAINREVTARVEYVEAARATEKGNQMRRNQGEI